MKVRLIKAAKIAELQRAVEGNLHLYREGAFDFLASDSTSYFELDCEIDEQQLSTVACTKDDHKEIANCKAMHNAFINLTPYLARDERLWIYLTHTHLLEYSRTRWPIPEGDGQAAEHIKKHFFVSGSRGFERENAASRLWWMAYLCNRVSGLSLDESLEALLYQTDVRANIIERPTTSLSPHVFSAILKKFHASYKGDKKLYDRDVYRPLMKQLNLKGGVKLLEAMDESSIEKIIDESLAK
jgi:hypothetical protein